MTLKQLEVGILRRLFPRLERERREFRQMMAEAQAHAEDMKREAKTLFRANGQRGDKTASTTPPGKPRG